MTTLIGNTAAMTAQRIPRLPGDDRPTLDPWRGVNDPIRPADRWWWLARPIMAIPFILFATLMDIGLLGDVTAFIIIGSVGAVAGLWLIVRELCVARRRATARLIERAWDIRIVDWPGLRTDGSTLTYTAHGMADIHEALVAADPDRLWLITPDGRRVVSRLNPAGRTRASSTGSA